MRVRERCRRGFGQVDDLSYGVTTERSHLWVKWFGVLGFAVGLEGLQAVQGGEKVALEGVDAPLQAGGSGGHEGALLELFAFGPADLCVPKRSFPHGPAAGGTPAAAH